MAMNTAEENSSKPLPACCQENAIDMNMKPPDPKFNLREFLLVTLSKPAEYWKKESTKRGTGLQKLNRKEPDLVCVMGRS